MVYTAETVRMHHQKWIQCHSVYGVHHGLVTHVLERGMILSHVTRVDAAHSSGTDEEQLSAQLLNVHADQSDVSLAFFPAPVPGGIFMPYGGITGIYPAVAPFGW
ncbi:hypothetical protein [Ferroacidibacillus organovorans]|uniref:Uncharacterized protein n=1 Tax=Ferroacidibacillus organovorans TaxID=1765683 RepID=A0A1V4EVD1_9BACL|nr:hypothetical protein [Ferroacidibacillus organovorans]OPG16879.1 hypothetical protein B2M26_04575 [Ferroacidibacillus organovorans]